MSVIIVPASRRYVFWPAVIDADPTGSTVTFEVRVDTPGGTPAAGSPFAMTWQATPVTGSGIWSQTARTNAKFVGSTATAGADVKLAAGLYWIRFLVTLTDAQVIASPQDRMVVQ